MPGEPDNSLGRPYRVQRLAVLTVFSTRQVEGAVDSKSFQGALQLDMTARLDALDDGPRQVLRLEQQTAANRIDTDPDLGLDEVGVARAE